MTTLKINSIEKPIEEWKLSKAKIDRRNCACDTFEALFCNPQIANGISIGDILEIFQNNIRKFFGRVTKLTIKGSGEFSQIEMLAKNSWNDLEECVYQQNWAQRRMNGSELILENVLRSKVVLGQNESGNKIDIPTQIVDILNFAKSCGANFEIGNINVASEMLFDEARDITCAEAITRVLKWLPNTCIYFDYSSQDLPTINIIARDKLENVQTQIYSGSVKNFEITPRPDLCLNGVCVKYESEDIINHESSISITEDKYPPNFDSRAQKALVMSVELDGQTSVCQSYEAVCETINPSNPSWWIRHVPELKNATNIVIENISRSGFLDRELREGCLPTNSSVKSETDTISAQITYNEPSLDGEFEESTSTLFNIKMVTTNAVTGTYNIWNTSSTRETPPLGLAKAIYDATSQMQYEGSISIINGDASDFAGKNICICGYTSELEQRAIQVVSLSQNLFDNVLRVNFGAPKHLYPDNIAELFRINRNRKFSVSAGSRATGKISASTTCSMNIISANSQKSTSRSSAVVILSPDGNKSIKLNTNDLSMSSRAKFREISICYNGRGAKAKFLMTEPVYDEY